MEKLKLVAVRIFLCMLMVLSLFPHTPVLAANEDGLVNIAPECEVKVPENEGEIYNMFDNNVQTIWSPSTQAGWPATVTFKLPAENMKPVEKVVMRFKVENKEQENWNMDVKLGYHINSVTTDELVAKEVKGHMLKDAFVFEFKEPTNISHALVTLNNPKNGNAEAGFWPQIAEMEIYVAEDEAEEDLTNLASNAIITSCGGNAGNASNLVDNNYQSLYVFYNGGMSSINGEAWVQADLGKDASVNALEIAFEKLNTDSNNFQFTYSIYGMNSKSSEWTKVVASAKADRTENAVKKHLLGVDGKSLTFSKFKIVIESITSTGGDPWPAIAEFKIFGQEEEIQDPDNIAWKKPTHTNTNDSSSDKITDGNISSRWSGAYYPGYVDIDLEENYNISNIEVYLPTSGYAQYDIYTSMDGRDFTKLVSKTSKESTPAQGDRFEIDNTEARVIRVYMNYNSSSNNAIINEVRVLGTPSGTPVQTKPAIEIEEFEGSEYDVEITEEMTINEVKGIVSRQLGDEYLEWFTFALGENPNGHDYDFFTLEEKNGTICITGNDGVSLATGLNHYLKYYLNVHISQVGNQVTMPENIVSLDGEVITRETKLPIRYAYNYCTLSYSMAFWGEEEWRNELDWLALNGVNTVLDATAQEEVWRRFLMNSGYTEQEAKDYIAGPAYYAWAYMANMSGYGGPVHDNWFVERTQLARSNQLTMRKLGMQPILQGYSGMVPVDIESKDPSTKGSVIGQGGWCSFTRPSMLNATSQSFRDYAARYYAAQKEVYGDVSDFYATDPYHEGGNPGGVSAEVVGRNVLEEMMNADPDAVWVIQSWGSNPTSGLLKGVAPNKEHALILDLYAEKTPRWENWNGTREFTDTPWVYCMLNNFGGRLGLHGHIDNFVNEIPRAINSTNYMRGIGITPEASVNNPVLYDLFFETIWAEDADNMEAINLEEWFKDYTTRRYGAESENAYEAMLILNDTVYNPSLNMKGQGAPESVVNARPAMNINAASTWGNSIVDYDKEDLEEAARLLLEDYEVLSASEAYQYDLANVLEQVLSNSAQEYHKTMVRAYNANDLAQFTEISDKYLSLIDMVDKVTGTQEKFMVGTWIEQAKKLAANSDEFTKELYEFNARSLITTWGSINQANGGGLQDYSNRQWSGLTRDYYKPRWERWINERKKDLIDGSGSNITNNDWFVMEWDWVNQNNVYETKPNGEDLSVLGEEILADYSVTSIPKAPEEDDSRDLVIKDWEIESGSEQSTSGSEGPVANMLDDDKNTIWHTSWSGTDTANLWFNIHLPGKTVVDGLRYLPRQNGANGIITGYIIEVSNDDGRTYHQVSEGTWAASNTWKMVTFEAEEITDIRVKVTNSESDQSGKNFASGAEVRLTGPVDKSVLSEAVAEVEKLNEENYTQESWAVLEEALNEAKAVLEDATATKEVIAEAVDKLNAAKEALVYKSADYTELNEVIKEAEALVKENYVDFSEVTKALEIAKALPEDLKITEQKQIDEVVSAIKNAMNNLELKKADYTKVDEAIKKANALNPENYEDFTAVSKAIEAVVRDLDITKQAEVDAMATAIEEAIANLELKKADIGDLKEFVEYAETLVKEDYYESGWAKFEEALVAAKELIADGNNIDQEAVNTALKELMDAASELRRIPDKSELEDLITKVEGMKAEDYTAESWAAFETALANAKAIYNAESEEAEVKAAQEALNAAIKGLEPVTTDPEEDKKPTTPDTETGTDTGDSTNVGGLLTLLGLAGMAIAYETRKRMR